MPSMRGAHSTGDKNFSLSSQAIYLILMDEFVYLKG